MPSYYNPYYYQPQINPNQVMQPQNQPQPQIQNGGFVSVRNETEARNYPVALGNSVTFKDETAPYIYTKTMGFSQLDVPRFDKYKLVKESTEESSKPPQEDTSDSKAILDTIDGMKVDIVRIWDEIDDIKNGHVKARSAKRDRNEDD